MKYTMEGLYTPGNLESDVMNYLIQHPELHHERIRDPSGATVVRFQDRYAGTGVAGAVFWNDETFTTRLVVGDRPALGRELIDALYDVATQHNLGYQVKIPFGAPALVSDLKKAGWRSVRGKLFSPPATDK